MSICEDFAALARRMREIERERRAHASGWAGEAQERESQGAEGGAPVDFHAWFRAMVGAVR